jgi:prepilin-type N-terminal cleavage/methylation domain-containing protein
MKKTSKKGFTLVELLATIAIMAVLVVAALPYVADYTSWAQATAQDRDAQVVAGAIARYIAVGASTTDWNGSATLTGSTAGGQAIIEDLVTGYDVDKDGTAEPFLAPNTDAASLMKRIRIGFTSATNWTVCGRTN